MNDNILAHLEQHGALTEADELDQRLTNGTETSPIVTPDETHRRLHRWLHNPNNQERPAQ